MDTSQICRWLEALRLGDVALSASLDANGRLDQVGGLWPKMLAAAERASKTGVVHTVIVSKNQENALCLENDASLLRVARASTLEEAIETLYRTQEAPLLKFCSLMRENYGQFDSGLEGSPIRDLALYVPRRFGVTSQAAAPFHRGGSLRPIEHEMPLTEVLRTYPRIVLTGTAGLGKTSFLFRLLLSCIEALERAEPAPLPIYLAVRSLLNRSIEDCIREFIGPDDIRNWFTGAVQENGALFLLDGLDEVTHREARMLLGRGSIGRKVRELGGDARFVITCRDASYAPLAKVLGSLGPKHAFEGFTRLSLQPLQEQEASAFVARFFRQSEERELFQGHLQSQVRDPATLMAVPLHLHVLCWLWARGRRRDSGVGWPIMESELWQELTEALHNQRGLSAADEADQISLLHALGFHNRFCQRRLGESFVEETAFRLAQARGCGAPRRTALGWVGHLRHVGLLLPGAGKSLDFVLPQLADYFAAEHLRDQWTRRTGTVTDWMAGRARLPCSCGQRLDPIRKQLEVKPALESPLLLLMESLATAEEEERFLRCFCHAPSLLLQLLSRCKFKHDALGISAMGRLYPGPLASLRDRFLDQFGILRILKRRHWFDSVTIRRVAALKSARQHRNFEAIFEFNLRRIESDRRRTRRGAARFLTVLNEARALDLLLRDLPDPSRAGAAFRALREMGDQQRAVPLLVSLMRKAECPEFLMPYILSDVSLLDLLDQIREGGVPHRIPRIDSLLPHLKDLNPAVRRSVVDYLGHLGTSDILIDLQPLLQDPDPMVRKGARRAARMIRARE